MAKSGCAFSSQCGCCVRNRLSLENKDMLLGVDLAREGRGLSIKLPSPRISRSPIFSECPTSKVAVASSTDPKLLR